MSPEELRKERDLIRAGIRVAIAEALEEHRRAGRKIAIWKNGKVVRVTVEEAMAPDAPAS